MTIERVVEQPLSTTMPLGGAPMAQSDTYLDPAAPIDDRVNDLLARLSVQEKAGQLTQYFYLRSMHPASDGADSADLPTEHRRPPSQPAMVEAEIRAGRAGSVLFVRDPATRNELQRLAVEHGPHRIPLIFGYDVIHGLRTIMPVPIAMAASWDPAVLEAAQASAAEQARAVGISWTFAPMVDIARDPRWGRIVEGAGEDPYLGAACAAAQVRGFQGGPDIGREGRVLAGPKHFAGYGAARGGRDYEDSEISDNELWNVYLPPFKAAVDAGAGNVMSAYMDLCGVPACGNRWLLTDVLRGTFGFEGFVVSDADAVQSLTTQHFAEDLTDAGARALMAGLDMEMGRDDAAYKRLPEALGAGLITGDRRNHACAHDLPQAQAQRAVEDGGRHQQRVPRQEGEQDAGLDEDDDGHSDQHPGAQGREQRPGVGDGAGEAGDPADDVHMRSSRPQDRRRANAREPVRSCTGNRLVTNARRCNHVARFRPLSPRPRSPLMVPVSLPSAIPATSKGPESCAMRAQRRLLGAVAPEYSGKGEAL